MEITGALTERPASSSVEVLCEEYDINPNAFSSVKPDIFRKWGVAVQTSGSTSRYNNTIYFNASKTWSGETSISGNSDGHNTLQPYVSIYIYKRIS